jgi:hypothetical protein
LEGNNVAGVVLFRIFDLNGDEILERDELDAFLTTLIVDQAAKSKILRELGEMNNGRPIQMKMEDFVAFFARHKSLFHSCKDAIRTGFESSPLFLCLAFPIQLFE